MGPFIGAGLVIFYIAGAVGIKYIIDEELYIGP